MAMINASGDPSDWWSDNGIQATAVNDFPNSNGGPIVGTGGNPAPPAFLGGSTPSTSFTNTSTVTPPLAPPTTPGGLAGPPPANGNFTDPNYASAFVQYYANQPGANPSLKNDPNYWIGKITSGELGADPNYIIGKFMTPEGAPAGGAAGTSNQFAALANGGLPALDAVPAPYASNPNAPQFSSLATPTDLSTPFTLPTEAELENMPGYQVGLKAGTQQISRSAAAQGTVLNPGTVQALNRYGTDYAGTQYANLTGESLAARQQNNSEFQSAQSTNTQLQTNRYGQYLSQNAQALSDYLTNYNINHTATTDYWNQLKDVGGAGLGAATALPTG